MSDFSFKHWLCMQNVEFYYTAEIIALIPHDNVPCVFCPSWPFRVWNLQPLHYKNKSPTDWTASPSPVSLIDSFLLWADINSQRIRKVKKQKNKNKNIKIRDLFVLCYDLSCGPWLCGKRLPVWGEMWTDRVISLHQKNKQTNNRLKKWLLSLPLTSRQINTPPGGSQDLFTPNSRLLLTAAPLHFEIWGFLQIFQMTGSK